MKSIFVILFAIIALAACGGEERDFVVPDYPSPSPVELYSPHAPYDPGPPKSITPSPEKPKVTHSHASRSHRASRSRRVTNQSLTQDSVWDRLVVCEASGDWSANTGNGYYGGLQFSLGTWRSFGGTGMPHHASRAEQIKIAKNVLAAQGWGAWPACSRKLGLR